MFTFIRSIVYSHLPVLTDACHVRWSECNKIFHSMTFKIFIKQIPWPDRYIYIKITWHIGRKSHVGGRLQEKKKLLQYFYGSWGVIRKVNVMSTVNAAERLSDFCFCCRCCCCVVRLIMSDKISYLEALKIAVHSFPSSANLFSLPPAHSDSLLRDRGTPPQLQF